MRCAPTERNIGFALILAQARVVQQGGDIGVAADGEEAVRQRRHRGLAQPGVERVGIGAVGRVENLRE